MAKTNLETQCLWALRSVFIVLVLVHLSQGSCLSFGHSCWGAHGKRSSVAAEASQPPSPNKFEPHEANENGIESDIKPRLMLPQRIWNRFGAYGSSNPDSDNLKLRELAMARAIQELLAQNDPSEREGSYESV